MMVDTLTIARELKAADLPSGQAAAVGRFISETAMTKADLENVRVALKAGLEALRHELRTEIERARDLLVLWVASTQIAIGGLITASIEL